MLLKKPYKVLNDFVLLCKNDFSLIVVYEKNLSMEWLCNPWFIYITAKSFKPFCLIIETYVVKTMRYK